MLASENAPLLRISEDKYEYEYDKDTPIKGWHLFDQCKHPAPSCVVCCKERGGALPTVTALTAQGMTIMRLFFVQVIIAN